jgi:hypothetical protein
MTNTDIASFYLSSQTQFPVNASYPLGSGMKACTLDNAFNVTGDPFGTPAYLFNGEWANVQIGAQLVGGTAINTPTDTYIYDLANQTLFPIASLTSGTINITCFISNYNPCTYGMS